MASRAFSEISGPVGFSTQEMMRRRLTLHTLGTRLGCDTVTVFGTATVQWLTGYPAQVTERPVAACLWQDGTVSLLVPLLRETQARLGSTVDEVACYSEYPGSRHPLAHLAELLTGRASRRVLLDMDGYASPHGYQGAEVSRLMPEISWRIDGDAVAAPRMVKSTEEITVLRHACAWATCAHAALHEQARPGLRESAIAGAATGAAMSAMLSCYGDRSDLFRPMRVAAGFGGQIGADGTAHHVPPGLDPLLRPGDVAISQVSAWIAGYYADIERTMIAGRPASPLRALFEQGCDLQESALAMIAPGMACAEIDRRLSRQYEFRGLTERWRHHVGHSIGILAREPPYLDVGDTTILQPGMVVTVEPGLYQAGVGGFRHSDCVLVTEHGSEILTDYPRLLDELRLGA
jgi:Xaa-Pro dipeptidase